MKLLLDTNVLIPLEPVAPELHANTAAAAELFRLAHQSRAEMSVHPALSFDIERDRDVIRRDVRKQLVQKYPHLPDPPSDAAIGPIVGFAAHGSNDWVDNQLLAALHADAVDYLITEDRELFRKARLLQLEDRVFAIASAAAYLKTLFDRSPIPPPAVTEMKAHGLNSEDPIFNSFRRDYGNDFDPWLRKCKLEHRITFVINGKTQYAALAIVNEERDETERHGRRTLKICSFKVADEYRGFRFGELLLKTIFSYAEENNYGAIFVTVFKKYPDLIALFADFGFTISLLRTPLDELKLVKLTKHSVPDGTPGDALEYNVRYGPAAVRVKGVAIYIVPIQPRYSDLLFPETAPQRTLFTGTFPFGNGIRKAYLCNSITRSIRRGDILCFYRSQSGQAVIASAVVEQTLVSKDAEKIARIVGKRTVYSFGEIEALSRNSIVLAILFRQSRILHMDVGSLIAHHVMKRAPQSIMRVREGVEWVTEMIAG
jgi:GNAT superfamily N-acetyltransferase